MSKSVSINKTSFLLAGHVLDSAKIGILAGAGYQNVTVRAPPKVRTLLRYSPPFIHEIQQSKMVWIFFLIN